MKPPRFEYVAPHTVDEALEHLARQAIAPRSWRADRAWSR